MNQIQPPTSVKPRFELGQIVATPGALEACPNVHLQRCLARHVRGDWGHVGAQDALQNEAALSDGWSVLSSYVIDPMKPCKGFGENRLWIVTEADRSATTLLLPEEYRTTINPQPKRRTPMTPEQRSALRNLVGYVLDTEEKHYFEELAGNGIEPGTCDPYALKALPYFPHIFRDALALKELAV